MPSPFFGGRIVVVPYLAHSAIRINNNFKNGKITFIGSPRHNELRAKLLKISNMEGVLAIPQTTKDNYVPVANEGSKDFLNRAAIMYADAMMTSTFCLVIAGDTISSRRLFDSIIAGCIPVIVTGLNRKDGIRSRNPQEYRFNRTKRNLPFSVRLAHSLFVNPIIGKCRGMLCNCFIFSLYRPILVGHDSV